MHVGRRTDRRVRVRERVGGHGARGASEGGKEKESQQAIKCIYSGEKYHDGIMIYDLVYLCACLLRACLVQSHAQGMQLLSGKQQQWEERHTGCTNALHSSVETRCAIYAESSDATATAKATARMPCDPTRRTGGCRGRPNINQWGLAYGLSC